MSQLNLMVWHIAFIKGPKFLTIGFMFHLHASRAAWSLLSFKDSVLFKQKMPYHLFPYKVSRDLYHHTQVSNME